MAVKIELIPTNGRKSFNGKAYIMIDCKNMTETLYSYDTPILQRKNGEYLRLWNGWSETSGVHIKAFCGMTKVEFLKIPLVK